MSSRCRFLSGSMLFHVWNGSSRWEIQTLLRFGENKLIFSKFFIIYLKSIRANETIFSAAIWFQRFPRDMGLSIFSESRSVLSGYWIYSLLRSSFARFLWKIQRGNGILAEYTVWSMQRNCLFTARRLPVNATLQSPFPFDAVFPTEHTQSSVFL